MEKIEKRLSDLYKGRTRVEKELVTSIRYSTNQEKITEWLDCLVEYRGRIQELEYLLSSKVVERIRKETNAL